MIDPGFWITASAILFLIVLSAFFSGSETALTAASRGKLRRLSNRGWAGAGLALKITEDRERLIGSVLLGNNLVNILATSLATALLSRAFGESGVLLATLIMTLLILIFAEVLPKTYAITNSETAASFVARPISVIVAILAPFVSAVRALVRVALRMFGVTANPDDPILAVREEIAGTLQIGHSEGVVEKDDRDRILGALDLSKRTVEEIMLHRSDIEMIDVAADPDTILSQCLQSPHTRLPIFKDDPENIVGLIHSKDLLRAVDKLTRGPDAGEDAFKNFDINEVAREPYFVPETTTLNHQMRQFLARRTHFALVVDEYGALRGLITLEDILEEIVGEITDEFDVSAEHPVRETEDGGYLVEGAMTIRDLNRAKEWKLPDEVANTVAGLVIHEARTIPTVGQVFSFHGFRFEVVNRMDNRITRLKIFPQSQ